MAVGNVIGLDIGSVSVKMVAIGADGAITSSTYKRHHGQPLQIAAELLRTLSPGQRLVLTGSGGKLLASILGVPHVNEVIALAAAVKRYHPDVKTVIEMGGEDSKLVILEDGRLKDFAMNSACAAGTGSFLDQQADRLNISIEGEFGELALKSKNPPRIAGRCSVFAKSDMIHLQQLATPDYDIVAGLCFAVARNFKSTIGRGKRFEPPILFAGGVAANAGMVRAFGEVMEAYDGGFLVPEHFSVLPAAGAALLAVERGTVPAYPGLDRLDTHLRMTRYQGEGLEPLMADDEFLVRCSPLSEVHAAEGEGRVDAYLGVDIGSISTNVVVIDERKRVLSKRYLMTAGRPIEAVRRGLREVGAEIGEMVNIRGAGTTGSGRYMIADFIGADIVKNEITAQATAAADIDPAVDTIFEIGGQDSKFISLKNGAVVDFEMNKVCAAGTGSFLEEQAEKLAINIKGQFGEMSLSSQCPISLGERCTVFMESALVSHQQKGAPKEDLVAGLGYSIVYNYLNRVVGDRKIGNKIFFQGGVAFNKGVAAAFERVTGNPVIVPPHHDVTGAIGMALIAQRHVRQAALTKSSFKGFDLGNRQYQVKCFDCKGCSNLCEIRQVTIDGEKDKLYFGSRCEKYDVKRKAAKEQNTMPRLFAEREEMLLKGYDPEKVRGPMIGIPFVLFMHEQFPFWRAFFEDLGFTAVLSGRSNKQTIRRGLEAVVAESCFPIKMAHGHILDLVDKGVERIFLPSFINLSQEGDRMESGVACPYVQTMPYLAKAAFGDAVKLVAPSVNFRHGMDALAREVREELKDYGVGISRIKAALKAGSMAQGEFYAATRRRGEEFLASLPEDGRAIPIISRPYNGCDAGLNLDLPDKLRDLGVVAIPMDFLPLGKVDISSDWPNMYWRSGQRILQAGEIVRKDPRLNAIYITNYGCGPDSFLIKYFREVIGDKPYLQLEVDEHSADAGAITRCEAFLDSVENAGRLSAKAKRIRTVAYRKDGNRRKIHIPRMCDQAFVLAAAFERHGVEAEPTPPADAATLALGHRHTTGKECYPCIITTGDMVKIATSKGFDPARAAFFMPSGTGPCRFGQYNMLHRLVLDELGFPEVPIYAPNQDEGLYRDLDMVGSRFVRSAWEGIVAVDLLTKCVHETRPYEKDTGEADALHDEFLVKVSAAVAKGLPMEPVLLQMKEAFMGVPRRDEQRPLIGMVGEIYVRSNEFSNESLIRKAEALGGEVWLAPFGEWIFYQNHTNIEAARRKGKLMEYFSCLTTHFFQKRIEHRYCSRFKDFLKTVHEPAIKDTLKLAKPYLRATFQGEAILSMGKSVDYTRHGVSGVINAMPFNCMPGTIVTALLKKFSEDHGGFPYLSMSFDGHEQANAMTRLEAFVHQAKQRHEDRNLANV